MPARGDGRNRFIFSYLFYAQQVCAVVMMITGMSQDFPKRGPNISSLLVVFYGLLDKEQHAPNKAHISGGENAIML